MSEQYFNTIAGRLGRNHCPGRSWEAIGRLALRLVPNVVVADLGAGEGLISQLLARNARQVWCIDNSPRMVEVGTELAKKNDLSNLTYKLGDIEQVPLADESVDLAILSQALHHAIHPQKAVDDFEKARDLYKDHWLGFKENVLEQFLKRAKFIKIEVNPVSKESVEPFFETLLATGTKS